MEFCALEAWRSLESVSAAICRIRSRVRWSSRPIYTAMSKSGGGHRWSRRKRPPSLAEIELSRTVVRRANNSHGSLGEAKP